MEILLMVLKALGVIAGIGALGFFIACVVIVVAVHRGKPEDWA